MTIKSIAGRFVRRFLGRVLGGRLHRINYRGRHFFIDLGDGVISWRLLLGIGYEEESKDLAVSLLRPGDIVVEAGANIGDYTLSFGSAVGSHGRVICFEPVPRSYQALTRNILENDMLHISAIQSAVGDSEGQCDIVLDASNFGGNSLAATATADRGEAISVPITTLNSVCEKLDLTPTLVKADIQGAEVRMLCGANNLLSNHKTAFWLEFWPGGLAKFGDTTQMFVDKIYAYEREVYLIDKKCLRPIERPEFGYNIAGVDGFVDVLSTPKGWLRNRGNG